MPEPASPNGPLDPDAGLADPAPVVEEEAVDPEEDPPSFGGLSSSLLGKIVVALLAVLVASKAWAVWYVLTRSEDAEKNDWAQILEQVGSLDAVVTAVVGGILGIKIQGMQTQKSHAKAKKNHDVAQRQKAAAEQSREAAETNRRKAHKRGMAIVEVAHELEGAAPRRQFRHERRMNLLHTAVPQEIAQELTLDTALEHQIGARLQSEVGPQFIRLDEDPDRLDESEMAQRLRSAL